MPASITLNAALLFGRLSLGLYLAFAGWRKVAGGVSDFAATSFVSRQPEWLPDSVGLLYGHAIPWLELLGGILLVIGFYGRTVALVAAFVLATIAIALFGTGDLIGLDPRLHHAPVLAALALLLAVIGPGRVSIDGWMRGR